MCMFDWYHKLKGGKVKILGIESDPLATDFCNGQEKIKATKGEYSSIREKDLRSVVTSGRIWRCLFDLLTLLGDRGAAVVDPTRCALARP